VPEKICSNCKQELPLSKFHKDKDKWDGYQTICRNCRSKYYYIRKIRVENERKEYDRRKSLSWIPVSGKYYRYRDYRNQPLEETIILRIKTVNCGKYPFITIDYEPIKSPYPELTQMTIAFFEVWEQWKFEPVTENYALKGGLNRY
jgi:hypothetical protein